ncbi:hypothetical protein GCM10010363_58830 [Streptomyces omiyaensis]|nr:hypothetical protein GCM10010363_58830 [Streptomyces omiyaensis]
MRTELGRGAVGRNGDTTCQWGAGTPAGRRTGGAFEAGVGIRGEEEPEGGAESARAVPAGRQEADAVPEFVGPGLLARHAVPEGAGPPPERFGALLGAVVPLRRPGRLLVEPVDPRPAALPGGAGQRTGRRLLGGEGDGGGRRRGHDTGVAGVRLLRATVRRHGGAPSSRTPARPGRPGSAGGAHVREC